MLQKMMCNCCTVLLLLFLVPLSSTGTSFPARLPTTPTTSNTSPSKNNINWWNDGGESDDDDDEENDETSSSDFEDTWMTTTTVTSQNSEPAPVPAIESNSSNQTKTVLSNKESSKDETRRRSELKTSKKTEANVNGDNGDDDDDDETEATAKSSATSYEQQSTMTESTQIGSQPLQTLERLQQMLDETDYRTTARSAQEVAPQRLWTSKDRSKYKKQQLRQQQQQQEQLRQLQQQQQQQQQTVSEHEISDDDASSTDDGLGYTLPDLPIYNSDNEETDEGDSSIAEDLYPLKFPDIKTGETPFTSQSIPQHRPPLNQYQRPQPPYNPYIQQQQQKQQSLSPPQQQQQQQPTAINKENTPAAEIQKTTPRFYPRYGEPPYLPQQPPTSNQYSRPGQEHNPNTSQQQQSPSPYTQQQQHPRPDLQTQQQQQQQIPEQYPPQQYPYMYLPPPPPPPPPLPNQQLSSESGQSQQPGQPYYYPPYYPPPMPYYYYPPQPQQLEQQQQQAYSQQPFPKQQSFIPESPTIKAMDEKQTQEQGLDQTFVVGQVAQSQSVTSDHVDSVSSSLPTAYTHPQPVSSELIVQETAFVQDMRPSSSVGRARLNKSSVHKISLMLVSTGLFSYAAVSPRTLPLTEYNLQFYENVRMVLLSSMAPFLYMLSVFDSRICDINAVVNTYFISFSVGYAATFLVEIIATTLIRLLAFCLFESNIFSMMPRVPMPILPWVLREKQYRPKRITLFAADFGTSCIAGPIIEEFAKLLLLKWTTKLPRNFNWVTKQSSKKKKKKRQVAEAIVRNPGETDCVTANMYITHMLAASIGLKLSDAGRRILLYTKPHHDNKSFYAICRGIFPIQELCGVMTALALAKRNLLGVEMPLWKLLAPAVVFHGMANFRGMKPIFKWNSSTPWSEMQLSPLHIQDRTTLFQQLKKGHAKLMWAIVVGRILGYCIKNYYMVNRKAVKRTTKYVGKHSAFSAELATAELLLKQKQKEKKK